MIDADHLAAHLTADDPQLDAAVARAVAALNAWQAWPRYARHGYPLEARRLARRAAVALVAVLEAAGTPGQEVER
jgi:hypothetical protein